MPCSYCEQDGHYRQTCKQRLIDESMWLYQQSLLRRMKQEQKKQIEELARDVIRKTVREAFGLV